MVEKTGLHKPTNIALGAVAAFAIMGFGIELGRSEAGADDVPTFEAGGLTDERTGADAELAEDLRDPVQRWNQIWAEPVRQTTSTNPNISMFLSSGTAALAEAPELVTDMLELAVQFDHDGLRSLMLDRIDVYQEQIVAFQGLVAAVEAGDADEVESATYALQGTAAKGDDLARELIEAFDDAQDSYNR